MTFIFLCTTRQNTAITLQSLNGFIDEKQAEKELFLCAPRPASVSASFQTVTVILAVAHTQTSYQ